MQTSLLIGIIIISAIFITFILWILSLLFLTKILDIQESEQQTNIPNGDSLPWEI